MNWDTIQGKWKQAMGSAKAKWGELTDDDLDQIDGEREKLVGKVQEKYGLGAIKLAALSGGCLRRSVLA